MISVVMPVYNGERFLAPALESILKQTYRDFELIVVNDGSNDRTTEILDDYAFRDSRIRVIQSPHIGLCEALNIGIDAAKNPWIARMDADDIAMPQRFEKQLNAAKHRPEVVVWGSYIHHINSAGNILSFSKVGPPTVNEFEKRRKRNEVVQVIHPTAFMRKDAVLKAGGYKPEYEAAEDVELFDRMGDSGPIVAVPEALLHYRVHPYSITMTRFFVQREFSAYIHIRRKFENQGKTPPTLEEFRQQYNARPLVERLRHNLGIRRQLYYRRAGMLFGNQDYLSAAYYFALSTVLDPRYSLRRVWSQRLMMRG
jgi:glycosyltransferase involved in cell wall biosynthesis